jgi:hypothetical protein
MILLPHFPFDVCETSTSFLRRLSLFHTGQGAERLLTDLSIDGNAFIAGEVEALSILATASEIDIATLQWGTIARFARHRKCRGERWSRAFVLPEGARFCPQCLLDDGADTVEWAGLGRLVWRLRPVLTCQIHCRRLVTLPEKTARSELNHRYYFGEELEELADQQPEQTPTVLENLIHDRISGRETEEGSWLRLQTIEQVTEACEMIGASVEQGPIFDVARMSPDAWRAAGAVGMTIATQGEDAIREALNGIAARSLKTSAKAGPRAIYGRLYEWLAYTTPVIDHGPVRSLLREQILDTVAIDQGELLLGEVVETRRLHSVQSLSVQTRLHPKRLRKLLVQAGLSTEERWAQGSQRLVFPAQLAERFCQDLLDCVPLHHLPHLLDCTRIQAVSLYRTGVLRPVVDRDMGIGIHRLAFANREVQDFLAFLGSLPVKVGEARGTVSLTIASKITGRCTGDLMGRIRAGYLPAHRSPGTPGLATIRLTAEDLTPLKVLVGAAVPG